MTTETNLLDAFHEPLRGALESFDRAAVDATCAEIVDRLRAHPDAVGDESVARMLGLLRNKRCFAHMTRVADAFLRSGRESAQVRRLLAQSFVDRGLASSALLVVEDLQSRPGLSTRELFQAKGLEGRIYKQIYLDARQGGGAVHRETLRAAIESYGEVYRTEPQSRLWHGINTVALLALADRDGVDVGDGPSFRTIAAEIRDEILRRDSEKTSTLWDLSTLAEAQVALGEWPAAAEALRRYAEHPQADAFELGSTLRQFEEIWQLDETDATPPEFLDLLRAELLRRSGGGLNYAPERLQTGSVGKRDRGDGLEALLGAQLPQSYTWLMECLQRANCVAKIRHGRKAGTGFVVAGEVLHPGWAGKHVLVTNNHVVAEQPLLEITMKPSQATVTFDALHGGGRDQPVYRVKDGKSLWESSIPELDTTCLELDQDVEGVGDLRIGDPPEGADRVYVIGHPMGGELSFSFQDNQLIDANESKLHYRSPTEPGSSGSPLFNDAWELVGLHHAGSDTIPKLDGSGETYAANEGICIRSVAQRIAEAPGQASSHE